MPTQRMHMKALLAAQEHTIAQLFKCLLSTMRPLMADGLENTKNIGHEARLGGIAL
jgi:hypothetical protein